MDGVFLDCCTSVPDTCQEPGSCEIAPPEASCQLNTQCDALNLTGVCWYVALPQLEMPVLPFGQSRRPHLVLVISFASPTADGVFLECCGTPVQRDCTANPSCKDLGLDGLCCDTLDGVFLDCCTSVPDTCQVPGSCDVAPAEASCELNKLCDDRNLTGVCWYVIGVGLVEGIILGFCVRHETSTQTFSLPFHCSPTTQGVTLECCGSAVKEACSANPKCDGLGLTGSCCPTIDDVYLDCCDVLPDDCVPGSATCNVTSATDYLALQNAKSHANTQHVLWTLSLVILAVWSAASS